MSESLPPTIETPSNPVIPGIQLFAPGPANQPVILGSTLFAPTNANPEAKTKTPEESIPQVLWSPANAIMFLILLVLVFFGCFSGISALTNIQHIKDDWANQRCSPLLLPFASFFGYNTSENFNFCMGKIFTTHSAPSMDSMGSIFGTFTTLLSSIFDSINSMRNTIASLGGGINVIFQEFTDRITIFFFTLRMSAIRLKMLFGRIYAILFSVMYMGMSGITGLSSFTNTTLFSFLDTFCFPGSTELRVLTNDSHTNVHHIPIKDIKIGDVLMPGHHKVTATFSFYAKGQPMVKIGSTVVSTNHYLVHHGQYIKAGDHPHAQHIGGWDSDEYLYCVNTSTNIIPVGMLNFLDYDETSEGDVASMRMIEERVNGIASTKEPYLFNECGFALQEDVCIRVQDGIKQSKHIVIGDRLSTGCQVVGVIRKKVREVCTLDGFQITASTLYWDGSQWVRFGERYPIQSVDMEMISFVVTPSSQIELANGIRVRDYMELCSPDAEIHYATHIKKKHGM